MRWIPIISRYRIVSNHIGYDRFNQSDPIVSDELIRSKLGESGKRIYKRNAINHRKGFDRIRSSSSTGFHCHPTASDPPYFTWDNAFHEHLTIVALKGIHDTVIKRLYNTRRISQ